MHLVRQSSSDRLPDLFWSIYINNIKYVPWMARNNNYRCGWKNDSVPEKDRVYFRFSDPVYKRLYRKKSSRPIKMQTGNKMENSSRIKIFEVASSCCGSLYELYRRKVYPATLAVSAHREFLGVPQHVRSQSQVSKAHLDKLNGTITKCIKSILKSWWQFLLAEYIEHEPKLLSDLLFVCVPSSATTLSSAEIHQTQPWTLRCKTSSRNLMMWVCWDVKKLKLWTLYFLNN